MTRFCVDKRHTHDYNGIPEIAEHYARRGVNKAKLHIVNNRWTPEDGGTQTLYIEEISRKKGRLAFFYDTLMQKNIFNYSPLLSCAEDVVPRLEKALGKYGIDLENPEDTKWKPPKMSRLERIASRIVMSTVGAEFETFEDRVTRFADQSIPGDFVKQFPYESLVQCSLGLAVGTFAALALYDDSPHVDIGNICLNKVIIIDSLARFLTRDGLIANFRELADFKKLIFMGPPNYVWDIESRLNDHLKELQHDYSNFIAKIKKYYQKQSQ